MISAEKKMQRTAFFCYSDDKNAARCIFIILTDGGAMAINEDLAVRDNANRNEGLHLITTANKKGAEPMPSTPIKRLLY